MVPMKIQRPSSHLIQSPARIQYQVRASAFGSQTRGGAKFDVRDLKESADGKTCRVKGYGSVFGNVDWYGTVVDKGAFAKTIQERPNPKMLWQHNPGNPLGLWDVCREDDHGLWCEGDVLLELAQGKEARTLMVNKVVDGLSIGFDPVKDSWDDVTKVLHFTELKLYEISPVTFPANELAGIEDVRSVLGKNAHPMLRELHKLDGVNGIAAKIFAALRKRDVGECLLMLDSAMDELLSLRQGLEEATEAGNGSASGEPGEPGDRAHSIHSLLEASREAVRTLQPAHS